MYDIELVRPRYARRSTNCEKPVRYTCKDSEGQMHTEGDGRRDETTMGPQERIVLVPEVRFVWEVRKMLRKGSSGH